MTDRTTEILAEAEKEDRRKSAIYTGILTVLFIILLFIPLFSSMSQEQQSGILVALGAFDTEASGPESGTPPANVETPDEVDAAPAETAPAETAPAEATPPPPPPPTESKPSPSTAKKVKTVDDPDVLALRKKKEEAKKKAEAKKKRDAAKRKQAEADKKAKAKAEAAKKAKAKAEAAKKAEAKAKAEAEAKAKAAAEAKRKAEEEKRRKAKALADKKKKFSDFLGGGNGNDDTAQGQENGDPAGTAPSGKVSTGVGDIGGGLAGRKVVYRPQIKDNSQATGKVIVKVCVNKAGKVISARYTQSGSTATDQALIDKAIAGAKKFKFGEGDVDKICGTITVNFKLK